MVAIQRPRHQVAREVKRGRAAEDRRSEDWLAAVTAAPADRGLIGLQGRDQGGNLVFLVGMARRPRSCLACPRDGPSAALKSTRGVHTDNYRRC